MAGEVRSLVLALYRKQLVLARRFDASPALVSLCVSPRLEAPAGAPPVAKEVVDAAAAVKAAFFAPRGGQWYMPVGREGGGGVEAFVRRAYRGEGVAGADGDTPTPSVRLDAALNIHREMLRLQEVVAQEAGDVRASTVPLAPLLGYEGGAGLAEAPGIGPGCLLVEHPAAIRPGRTLLLVYDVSQNVREVHGNEEWVLRALVVNRPLPGSVASMSGAAPDSLGLLGDLPLFHGGTEGGALYVVHRRGDVPGGVAIDPLGEGAGAGTGLFLGGDAGAINGLLDSGDARGEEFKVLQGGVEMTLAVDESGGLSLPDAGRWLCVSGPCVAALSMLPPLYDEAGPWRGGRGLGVGEQVEGYNYGRFWHQNAAWAHAWAHASPSTGGGDVHTSVAHYAEALGPLTVQLLATARLAYAQAAEEEAESEAARAQQDERN